jgi:Ni,Fe-hydrogenase III small subunit
MVNLPKYHTGGYVNYAYGSEVAAMLQGGEVVIPKEIVKSIQHGATNNSSVYNNTPNITINVAGTNASPQDIANAVSQAMQKRQNMVGSRTVIR